MHTPQVIPEPIEHKSENEIQAAVERGRRYLVPLARAERAALKADLQFALREVKEQVKRLRFIPPNSPRRPAEYEKLQKLRYERDCITYELATVERALTDTPQKLPYYVKQVDGGYQCVISRKANEQTFTAYGPVRRSAERAMQDHSAVNTEVNSQAQRARRRASRNTTRS